MKFKLSSVCIFAVLLTFASCLLAQEVITFPEPNKTKSYTIAPQKTKSIYNKFSKPGEAVCTITHAEHPISLTATTKGGTIKINGKDAGKGYTFSIAAGQTFKATFSKHATVAIKNNEGIKEGKDNSIIASCKGKLTP